MRTALTVASPRLATRPTPTVIHHRLFSTVWAVTHYEMRLQWRTPVFWVVLALFAGITPLVGFIRAIESSLYPYLGSAPSFLELDALNWTGIAAFYAVLAPLAALFALYRDLRWRTLDLLWTRPITTVTYVAGKALALAVLLAVVSAAGIALYWAVASLRAGTPLPPFLFVVQWGLLVLPTILLAITVCLVLSLLLPHPLLGLAAWWGAVWYLGFYQLCTMLRWQNVFLTTLWYRPGARFGPDTPLLVGNRLIWLGILLGLLGLAPLFYRLRYKVSAGSRMATLWSVGLLSAALIAGGGGSAVLQDGIARVMEPATPIVAATQLANVDVTAYQAAVTLAPASGTLSGSATFTLTSTPGHHAAHRTVLALATNTGLMIDAVTVDGHNVSLQQHLGLTTLTLPDILPRTLRVTYHGFLRISRYNYGSSYQEAGESYGVTDLAEYLGTGLTYLTAAGDWYPVPQTASATR